MRRLLSHAGLTQLLQQGIDERRLVTVMRLVSQKMRGARTLWGRSFCGRLVGNGRRRFELEWHAIPSVKEGRIGSQYICTRRCAGFQAVNHWQPVSFRALFGSIPGKNHAISTVFIKT
jgi:hypothetical protein